MLQAFCERNACGINKNRKMKKKSYVKPEQAIAEARNEAFLMTMSDTQADSTKDVLSKERDTDAADGATYGNLW